MGDVVLHAGFRKTGTSSIQHWLRDNEAEVLHPRGLRFPPGWLRLNNHLELPLVQLRPERMSTPRSRNDEWRDPRFQRDVTGQVQADLARHPNETTILSAEDMELYRYGDELGALADVVGRDAHVIITLRDRGQYRDSLVDQLHKSGVGLSYDRGAFNCVEPDSWLFDYDARVDKWRTFFPKLTIIDYDAAVRCYGSIIPAFAGALGISLRGLPEHTLPTILNPEHAYWLNPRGGREHRPDGNRWTTGAAFGVRGDLADQALQAMQ